MRINVSRKVWISIGVTVGLAFMIWAASTALAQGLDMSGTLPAQPSNMLPESAAAPAVPAGGPSDTMRFTYQGLLEIDGQPVTGNYLFKGAIYDAQSGGTNQGACSYTGADVEFESYVEDGLFTLYLICKGWNSDAFTGAGRWLDLWVAPAGTSDWVQLTDPLQPISPTPYAFSLFPGAIISGAMTGSDPGDAVLNVRNVNGIGVYGMSDCADASCYGGYFEGGVGISVLSHQGYTGQFISEEYRAIYAESLSGWYDAYFAGLGGIYSAGGYWSKLADRTVAVNGGKEPLEPGDVVAIAGVVETPDGETILAVARADETNLNAVVGVAVQALQTEMRQIEGSASTSWDVQPVEGAVPPGGYVAIVTSGLVAEVRVETGTLAAGLSIGDWLTASSVPGAVRRVDLTRESTLAVLGKVAGPVNVENGTVPVFITLR
jgi:hypothetical protein